MVYFITRKLYIAFAVFVLLIPIATFASTQENNITDNTQLTVGLGGGYSHFFAKINDNIEWSFPLSVYADLYYDFGIFGFSTEIIFSYYRIGGKTESSNQHYDPALSTTLTTKKSFSYTGWEIGTFLKYWISEPVSGAYIGIGGFGANRFVETRTKITMPGGLVIYKDTDVDYKVKQFSSITAGYLFRFGKHGFDIGARIDGKIWSPEGMQIYAMFTESVMD